MARTEKPSGLPTFVWLNQRTAEPAGKDATEVAWNVLRELSPTYQMSETAMKTVKEKAVHDLGQGSILVKFEQEVDGLEVFLRTVTVAMDQSLKPVAASGHFAPAVKRTAASFQRPVSEAIAAALQSLIGASLQVGEISPRDKKGSYTQFTVAPVVSGTQSYTLAAPARTKQVLFPTAGGLVPAYYIELGVRGSTDAVSWRSFVISAADNAVLFNKDLTAHDAYTYRVWADAAGKFTPNSGPYGDGFLPHPTGKPDGSLPTVKVPTNLVTLQNVPFSKNDPWLPPGATEAKGNNAWAYADLVAPDGFGTGDLTLVPSMPSVFDYTIDPELDSKGNNDAQRAGITQLFYDINYLHDTFYDAGFDEKSGNAQTDNYGRGGVGEDAILAQSQDYSGTDNANCSTLADGGPVRIQMYGWNNPATFTITEPADLAKPYTVSKTNWGQTSFSGVSGELVLVNDAGGTSPTDGCEIPYSNAAAMVGKLMLFDRGTCSFTLRSKQAQLAGAIGAVMIDRIDQGTGTFTATNDPTITIPTIVLRLVDGNVVKAKIAAGTPVKGTMQSTTALRNGSLDNVVIAHEWGHYLSNRLIGNAGGLETNQSAGLGEGWSDFVALLALVRPEAANAPSNVNWMGTFGTGSFDEHLYPNSYYYGIRRYPYSSDLTKNPLTYKHISSGNPLPTMPAPSFGQSGVDNAEVHNTGEVWTSMLWDCYTNMLRDTSRYTFDKAQTTMREYLVAALKLTPISPTLLDARDALLATMYARDKTDFAACAASFARRKAGTGALAPDPNDENNAGAVESNKTGSDIALVDYKLDDSARSCDNDGIIDNTETGRLTVTIRNPGTAQLTDATVTVTGDSQYFFFLNGGKVAVPVLQPYQSATVQVDFLVKDAPAAFIGNLHISATSPTLLAPKVLNMDVKRRMNYDVAVGAATTDTFGVVAKLGWTTGGDPALSAAAVPWKQIPDEMGAGVFTIPDNGLRSDQYLITPPIVADATESLGFSFKHHYSFEFDLDYNYDGAVIEISTDNGTTWTNLAPSVFTKNGYNGENSVVVEEAEDEKNPIIDPVKLLPVPGFVQMSAGYPADIETVADLGTAYAGQTVRLRFRVGTDPAVGTEGWQISQISVTGTSNKPFPKEVAQPAACTNQPPVVTVTPAEQTVPSGRTANLQGTVIDPDNDSVVYEWVQLSGPTVMIANPTSLNQAFTVPVVTENTEATFALRASDGKTQVDGVGKVTFSPPTSGTPGTGGTESTGCSCRTVPAKNRAADLAWDFLWVALAGLYCHRRRVLR